MNGRSDAIKSLSTAVNSVNCILCSPQTRAGLAVRLLVTKWPPNELRRRSASIAWLNFFDRVYVFKWRLTVCQQIVTFVTQMFLLLRV